MRTLDVRGLAAAILVSIVLPATSVAQDAALTLDEAIQIALVQNNVVRSLRLDQDNATALVREGFGELFPQISASSSFTRNLKSANPFSGSSAGSFFEGLGFIEWLSFNEQARTDADDQTTPISVSEYFSRQQAGLDAAGVSRDGGDNPFAVPSQYSAAISITQKLFDGRAILGATGAKRWLKPLQDKALEREEQVLVAQVKASFYGALLADQQSDVVSQSVSRSSATLGEVSRQVTEGVAPKFQRLSAEVELANLETQLVQARNTAVQALDDLKLLIGVPADQQLQLRGALEMHRDGSTLLASQDAALNQALNRRPDLEQARISVELERVQLRVAKSEYLPTIDGFLNIGYQGNVPDSRQSVTSDPADPFSFSTQQNGYFSDAYWDMTVNAGFRLNWTLFNGFASHQRIQQRRIAIDKAEITHEFLQRSVAVEVERSLRDVQAARQRLMSQERNVDRAELNYTFAEARLKEGVASPLEVREASTQLDQSRINYLQAIHDFLVAESSYETAIGTPVNDPVDATRTR